MMTKQNRRAILLVAGGLIVFAIFGLLSVFAYAQNSYVNSEFATTSEKASEMPSEDNNSSSVESTHSDTKTNDTHSSQNDDSERSNASSLNSETTSSSSHTHDWSITSKTIHHDAVTHTETVYDGGEDIVEYHTICDDCGTWLDTERTMAEHYSEFPLHAKNGYTIGYPVVVGNTGGSSHQETVIDSEAYDETITTKTCKICGTVETETTTN